MARTGSRHWGRSCTVTSVNEKINLRGLKYAQSPTSCLVTLCNVVRLFMSKLGTLFQVLEAAKRTVQYREVLTATGELWHLTVEEDGDIVTMSTLVEVGGVGTPPASSSLVPPIGNPLCDGLRQVRIGRVVAHGRTEDF